MFDNSLTARGQSHTWPGRRSGTGDLRKAAFTAPELCCPLPVVVHPGTREPLYLGNCHNGDRRIYRRLVLSAVI